MTPQHRDTFERLDQLSRIRALTDAESEQLERVIRHATPKPRLTAKEARAWCEAAAIRHGLTVDQIIAPDRTPHIIAARRGAMMQMSHAGWSYAAIGRAMSRHHSTVMHALGLLA